MSRHRLDVRVDVSAESLSTSLRAWLDGLSVDSVSLRENLDLEANPQDDYHVIYEAVFEPASVDQMQVEIGLEADGYLAVGLERRTRDNHPGDSFSDIPERTRMFSWAVFWDFDYIWNEHARIGAVSVFDGETGKLVLLSRLNAAVDEGLRKLGVADY